MFPVLIQITIDLKFYKKLLPTIFYFAHINR